MSIPDLPCGKRMPGATYVAREVVERVGGAAWQTVVSACAVAGCDPTGIDVIKWHQDGDRISLLRYPGFLVEAHPALAQAITVDLGTKTWREMSYGPESDAPVLHRCELFIEAEHPRAEALRELTRIEERFGLYADSSRIGFRSHWQHLLIERGLSIDGCYISVRPEAPQPAGLPVPAWPTERQRTAIIRPSLSVPPRLLLERALLRPGDRYFDYGCGHGRDLPLLSQMGITVHGWDPAHRPAAPMQSADVVHCGYVLNVVETPEQRAAIIRDAWQYSERLLSVAVRVRPAESPPTGTQWGDGELTRSGTFQRYFSADELPRLLEETLGQPVLALAPGIAVVAHDAAVLHEVMARRVRNVVLPENPTSGGVRITTSETILAPKIESAQRRLGPRQCKVAALLDEVGPLLRELGRAPRPEEWTSNEMAVALGMSAIQVWNAFTKAVGPEAIANLEERRRTDALVFLAMAHFQRIPTLAELPQRTRIDIADLCGGHRAAVAAARTCLTQAGDPKTISRLCDSAGVGVLDEQALYIHVSLLPRLHPVLRCYVGCAEMLGAPVSEAHIIKIHKRSRKVSLMIYQDFEVRPTPALIERIKIDLRACTVLVFDHRAQPRQLLFDKDMYLAEDDPRRVDWQRQGEELMRIIGPVHGYGLNHLELRLRLAAARTDPDLWVPEIYLAPEPDDHDTKEETPDPVDAASSNVDGIRIIAPASHNI